MCSEGDAASVSPGESCRAIEVPQVVDCLQPVINVVPLQVCLQPSFEPVYSALVYPYNITTFKKVYISILVSKVLLFVYLYINKHNLNCMSTVSFYSLLSHELLGIFSFEHK